MKNMKILIACLFIGAATAGSAHSLLARPSGQTEKGMQTVRPQTSVSVNIADYLLLFTLNGEIGIPLSSKWNLTAGVRYNPWTFRKAGDGIRQFQLRQIAVRAGARYWPWHINSGWFAGSFLRWERYNRGGIFGKKTYEGRLYGLEVNAGYAWMLGRHLNLEFGAGIGSGYTEYKMYACPNCGKVVGEDKKIVVYPDNLLIQLTYLF